jgi:hypothetical protein
MAKKRRSKSRSAKGKGAKAKSKASKRKPRAKPKAKKAVVKVRAIKTDDPWGMQKALRKKKYFARAVGPNSIATNAPSLKAA